MTLERRFFKPPPSEVIAKAESATPEQIHNANEDKDAKMTLALERLDQGVEKLLQDPTGYFCTMARFHKYSLANTLMIFAQRPDATHVAGYRQWQEKFNRQVQRGEQGIKIFYPRFRKALDEETGEIIDKLAGFGVGSVFDVTQTEGEPLPEHPPVTENLETTDVSTAVNIKLSRYLIDEGLRLESIPMDGHKHGFYSPGEKKIAIRLPTMTSPFTVSKTKTLAHESAHWLADHKGGIDRRDAETVAEASAFVAMAHFNLDTELYSATYIASWAEDRERLHTNLAEIRRVGGRIIDAVEGISDPYEGEFGSWESRGEGPRGREYRELMDEIDRTAPNF